MSSSSPKKKRILSHPKNKQSNPNSAHSSILSEFLFFKQTCFHSSNFGGFFHRNFIDFLLKICKKITNIRR